jgi:hypothetical protein
MKFSLSPSKSAETTSLKIILDLATLSGKSNKDLVSEDPIVNAVGISVSIEIYCFTGVEATANPAELDVIFFAQPRVMGGNFAILLGGI